MTKAQSQYLVSRLKESGIRFEEGLTRDEIRAVERQYNLSFPKDLDQFLSTSLPVTQGFPHWRNAILSTRGKKEVNKKLDAPLQGILFDVKYNNFWQEEWGVKTQSNDVNLELTRKYYSNYPKLIPIYLHRYLPSTPNEPDNPVFSVYQMDIIYYGFNLAEYLANEFDFELNDQFSTLKEPVRQIKFWSKWT